MLLVLRISAEEQKQLWLRQRVKHGVDKSSRCVIVFWKKLLVFPSPMKRESPVGHCFVLSRTSWMVKAQQIRLQLCVRPVATKPVVWSIRLRSERD
jgi:hypothetical protein